MIDNVIEFPKPEWIDDNAADVINDAANAKLKDVLVIGWTDNGDFYYRGSCGQLGDVLMLIEVLKHRLISQSLDRIEE